MGRSADPAIKFGRACVDHPRLGRFAPIPDVDTWRVSAPKRTLVQPAADVGFRPTELASAIDRVGLNLSVDFRFGWRLENVFESLFCPEAALPGAKS